MRKNKKHRHHKREHKKEFTAAIENYVPQTAKWFQDFYQEFKNSQTKKPEDSALKASRSRVYGPITNLLGMEHRIFTPNPGMRQKYLDKVAQSSASEEKQSPKSAWV